MQRPGSVRHLDHKASRQPHYSSLFAGATKLAPQATDDVRGIDYVHASSGCSIGNLADTLPTGRKFTQDPQVTLTGCQHDASLGSSSADGANGQSFLAEDSSNPLWHGFSFQLSANVGNTVAPTSTGRSNSNFAAVNSGIDGRVINQLLQHSAASSVGLNLSHSPDLPRYGGGELGSMPAASLTKAASSTAAPTAPPGDLSPAVQQLLLGLPSEQRQLFSHALGAAGNPQSNPAMQQGSLDPVGPVAGLAQAACGTYAHALGTVARAQIGGPCSFGPTSSHGALPHTNQLQAALATEVGHSLGCGDHVSPAAHGLMQLLAAEQQALAQQPSLPQYQSVTSVCHSAPAAANNYLAQCYQALCNSPTAASPHDWQLGTLSAPAGAYNAAAAASMVQQQQNHVLSLMQAAMCGSASGAAAYNQPMTQLLSAQLAAAAATSYSNAMSPLAKFATAAVAGSTHVSTHGAIGHAFGQHEYSTNGAMGFGSAKGSPPGLRGRRSRCGARRSSSGSLLQHSFDTSASGLLLSKAGALDSTAAAAVHALSPATFQDYWGAEDTARDTAASQDGSCLSVYAASTSSSSSSEGGLGVCSRRSSVVSVGSPLASRRLSSADGEVFAIDLGPSRDVSSPQQFTSLFPSGVDAADAIRCSSRDQSAADSMTTSKAVSALPDDTRDTALVGLIQAGPAAAVVAPGPKCRVWYPEASEHSGDDSWYLELPPTCRLFVGNIGCWVDEGLLLSYFGKYGNVVDVQVMWNTKMLARGRRVNREFAFISYSTPLEAARAVHWLDGCRLADVEKDKNGITVEYENGEGEASPARNNPATPSKQVVKA